MMTPLRLRMNTNHGGTVLTGVCAVLTVCGWAAVSFLMVLVVLTTEQPVIEQRAAMMMGAISAVIGCIGLVGWMVSGRKAVIPTGQAVADRLTTTTASTQPAQPAKPGEDTFVGRAVGPTLKTPPKPGEVLPELPRSPYAPPVAAPAEPPTPPPDSAQQSPDTPPVTPEPDDDPFRPRIIPPRESQSSPPDTSGGSA